MKAVVGFEETGRIELFHCDHMEPGGVAVGTLGAETQFVRLRVVPIRTEAFRHRLVVAAGCDAFQTVEFAG